VLQLNASEHIIPFILNIHVSHDPSLQQGNGPALRTIYHVPRRAYKSSSFDKSKGYAWDLDSHCCVFK
jgi:hypothetical protein